jgi:hypothetical protein
MTTAADPDKACPHEDLTASVEVNRLLRDEEDTEPHGYSADIKITCAQCGEPFRWIGLQAGMKPDRPMCSVDETTLVAPLRPASSDPDFGMGIPGYAVTWAEA